MPFGIQPWHIVVIVLVALIIFGPAKLPELGRSIGKSINEFRTGAREMTESLKEEVTREDGVQPAESRTINRIQTEPFYSTINSPTQYSSEEAPRNVSGIFCTQCGTANPTDSRFCKSCGKQLSA